MKLMTMHWRNDMSFAFQVIGVMSVIYVVLLIGIYRFARRVLSNARSSDALKWVAITHRNNYIPIVWICDSHLEAKQTIEDALCNDDTDDISEAEDRRVSDYIAVQEGEFTVKYGGFHYSVVKGVETINA
jgi:hypothetical protein